MAKIILYNCDINRQIQVMRIEINVEFKNDEGMERHVKEAKLREIADEIKPVVAKYFTEDHGEIYISTMSPIVKKDFR